MKRLAAAFGVLLAASVLTQTGSAERTARVQTLVAAPVRITALAQDGRRIAWLQPGLKRRVGVRDLVKHRSVFLPQHRFVTDMGGSVPLPVIALAGNRIVYVLYEEYGNTQQDFYVVTTGLRDRTERVLGAETQGNCPCEGALPTWPLAADGARALFTLRGSVFRLVGRKAVRVQGRNVGNHLAVSGTRYASAWLHSRGGCICAHAPAWSPDGSRIAFGKLLSLDSESPSPRIAVVPASGGTPTTIASGRRPDWSPDGSLIAFQRGVVPVGVYVMRPDGTQARKVLEGSDPDWHPDGRRLAFVRDGAIHVAGSDGSAVRRLAQGESPAWSPDGLRLAYERAGDIYVVNADGTGPTPLTARSADDIFNVEPSWSPDGRQIAYIRYFLPHAVGDITQTEAWVMRVDGGGKRRLALGPATSLAWSPDGSRLAYSRWLPRRHPAHGNPATEIFTSAPDGTGQVRVTNTRVAEPVSAGFVRTLSTPRRSTGLRVSGVVRELALSSGAVAVLAEHMNGTRLTLLQSRTGRVLQRVDVPDEARMVSAAGRNVVFAVGREIRLLRLGQREPRTIAVTPVTPRGLSIEGRRVAWIETRGRRGLIRALIVPR